MATSEYLYYYAITAGTPPGSLALAARTDTPTTVVESDAVTDGATAAGDAIDWSGSGGADTLLGTSADGEPVISDGVDSFLVSNNENLGGTIVASQTAADYDFDTMTENFILGGIAFNEVLGDPRDGSGGGIDTDGDGAVTAGLGSVEIQDSYFR